jgi:hypothetical protein
VEVRSPREILDTLDGRGALDGMPFMPEMAAACGRRFVVYRRADKVCDTINSNLSSRNPGSSVFLQDSCCDGASHGGCEAECRVYWKDAWLRLVDPGSRTLPGDVDRTALDELLRLTEANTRQAPDSDRFRCQATQLVEASQPLKVFDPRPYINELTGGNVRIGRWVKVMGRVAVMQTAQRLGHLAFPVLVGATATSPTFEPLDLQPGEWVRVKSAEEIRATLNDKGKNRGLWFDREFLPYCGGVYRVRNRVERIIDEPTGRLIELTSDCVVLENVVCTGDLSPGRWFCPREIPCYWRECWLERVEPPASG